MTHYELGAQHHLDGYYDKWFRYHAKDGGYSYDQGWKSVTTDKDIQIIEAY